MRLPWLAAARSAFSLLPLALARGPPSTRMTGGVRRAGVARPAILEQQSAWSHYSTRDEVGRIIEEWWMPPFLVPNADVAPVPKGSGEEALMQCSVDPASGGPETHQHYTNIHRIARLASCHPMVISQEPFELAVGLGRRQATFNSVGRARVPPEPI